MKPFDLEKALAGELVLLRCGLKAFIKFKLPEAYTTKMPLIGYYQEKLGNHVEHWWFENGNGNDMLRESNLIGMWQEPQPRVQLDLPAPLKHAEENQIVFKKGSRRIGIFQFFSRSLKHQELLAKGSLFATKEDAQEWLDAMKGARK